MSFLGIFGKKDSSSAVKKHGARVANRKAQAPDRWDSIQALAAIRTPEAAEALLARFDFRVDPSITDQDEKEAAYSAIVAVGEACVPAVRAYLARSESIGWPMKMLEALLPVEAVTCELLLLLSKMDTEYERDPSRKLQVLADLEQRKDARIGPAVLPFLEDVNETARFHAAGAALAQEGEGARAALEAQLAREESMRVRARILDGFIDRRWALAGDPATLRAKMPAGYTLGPKGNPTRA